MDDSLTSAMAMALLEARKVTSDIPVGAVIVDESGFPLFKAHNQRELEKKLLGHAECLVMDAAWSQFGARRLSGLTLVSTLEPCLVCASLIRETRLTRVVFGASNQLKGAGGSFYDILRDSRIGPPPEVIGGVLASESQDLLRDFFHRLRKPD